VVAALCDPHGSGAAAILAEVAGAAKSLGLELVTVNASDPAQFDAAFVEAEHAGAGVMLITAAELFTVSRANRDRLVELTAKHRLPAMFSLSETAETGGLISYSADPVDGYRQVGIYVGRTSRVSIPVTCRSCSRLNSFSPSTSRPRRRWASPRPLRSSPWPTR
jgi:putative tryptophan/tyrosine transport system substrate-binding protein